MAVSVDGSAGVDAPDFTKAGAKIVESGSNANGTWIKFADGTLIQRGVSGVMTTNLPPSMGGIYGADGTHTFPVPFFNADYTVNGNGTGWTNWGGWAVAYSTESLTGFGSRGWSGSSAATFRLAWMAIGRWKA